VLFQCVWFAVVLDAAQQRVWLGCLCIVLLMSWHLSLSSQPRREVVLIVCALMAGLAFETVNLHLGFMRATAGQIWPALPAFWLVAMWGLLAMTLNVSLRWLKHRWWLASLSGAVAGPLAYAAGARLGALVLVRPTAALLTLAIGWALLLPVLVWLSNHFDGVAHHA
jgi:Protein of unknown function (DUF2878)